MTVATPETPIIEAINEGVELNETLNTLNAPAFGTGGLDLSKPVDDKRKLTLSFEIGANTASVMHRLLGDVDKILLLAAIVGLVIIGVFD